MIEIGDTAVNIVRNCIPMRNCMLRERLWSESHFRLVSLDVEILTLHDFGFTVSLISIGSFRGFVYFRLFDFLMMSAKEQLQMVHVIQRKYEMKNIQPS